jgi:hypothetical protein
MFECIQSATIDGISFEKGKLYFTKYQYPETILLYGETAASVSLSRKESDPNFFGKNFKQIG